jgi:ribonuclease E
MNDTVVVRFPPVALPPFTLPEPAAPPAPRPAEPPRAEAPIRPPEERAAPPPRRAPRGPERGPARRPAPPEPVRAEAPPPTRPEAAAAAIAAPSEEHKLSPSQKRRLRRKRRRESLGVAAPQPAPPAPPAARVQRPESPLIEEPEREPAEAELESRFDGADVGESVEIIEPADREDVIEVIADEETAAEAIAEEPEPEAEPELEPAEARGQRRRGRRGGRGRRRRERGYDRERPSEIPMEGVERAVAAAAPARPTREMIINVVPREECRIAILHEGKLEEIYMERASSENYVGNIYRGVVTNVEASIQAAFIDFGQGRNGFLHISDLHPTYFPDGADRTENVGRKLPRRSRPPIQRCLRRGQEINVQVTKEGIGTKGPTLSTYLSIPGRFLVMMPGMGKVGVSRRIEDEEARQKLRDLLGQLELPDGMGFIARTAALERTPRELESDLQYLTRLWRAVENRMKNDRPPCELYRESDLVTRTIRDVYTSDVARIVIDDPEVARRAREFLSIFHPRSEDIVVEYTSPEPIFHRHGIEAELERLHSRHVPLRIGGSLVIDQTEALVAIDVNSGRFRTEDDAETTAYKINLEAADEIARQLRLRDLGGVIICDFIDMRMESHRREIERRLVNNLKAHKERAKVLRMSAFGIIELTRQRQRASLQRSVYQECHHCRGSGLVKTAESVALDVMRLIQLAVTKEHIHLIEVLVSPEVAYLLQNRRRKTLYELEQKNRRSIAIKAESHLGLDQYEFRCTDARGRLVPHT